MARETVQQVVDYLKTHPEEARKAKEYIKAHPDEARQAVKKLADERGWDLSGIDPNQLKTELGKLADR